MIIDIIVVIVLVMAIIKGIRRGLIIALFSVIAFIIGIAAAMKLSVVVADYLKDSVNVSAQWMPVLSFAIVLIAVILLVRWVANMLERVVEVALMGWVNKLGGVVLYGVVYLLCLSVIFFFASQLKLINEETIRKSITWSWIQPWGPWVIDGVGKLVPVFKDMFTSLEEFFARIAKSAGH
jgi:membrane protein required for colicin V production